MNLSKRKRADFLVLVAYLSVAFVVAYFVPIDRVVSLIVFFGLPSLYLVIRYWRIHKHAFWFSLLYGTLTGLPFQAMAELNNIWKYDVFLDWLHIGGVPLDAVAWYIFWVGFTVTIYRVFFDTHTPHREKAFWKHHRKILLLAGGIIAATSFLLAYAPDFFILPHPYIIFATLFLLLPAALILVTHPPLLREVLKSAVFFTLFAVAYEVIGLRSGWWSYPGEFIGHATLLGVSIPYEEIVLWILLGSLAVVTIFEEFEMHEQEHRHS